MFTVPMQPASDSATYVIRAGDTEPSSGKTWGVAKAASVFCKLLISGRRHTSRRRSGTGSSRPLQGPQDRSGGATRPRQQPDEGLVCAAWVVTRRFEYDGRLGRITVRAAAFGLRSAEIRIENTLDLYRHFLVRMRRKPLYVVGD
jgi:hypothetical protein